MPRIRESTLRKLIENGETNTVELKVAVPRPGEMAERLCGWQMLRVALSSSGLRIRHSKLLGYLLPVWR